MKEMRYPIRLMFGFGDTGAYSDGIGFSAVYEKDDGSAGRICVWYNDESFERIKFTNENKSEIIFEEKERGVVFKEKFWDIKEIIISRNAMIR